MSLSCKPEQLGYEDAFDKLIADGTANEADIAGHYPFSPERWRFYATDNTPSNRIFLQYSSDARYNHQRLDGNGEFDVHTISPSSSETLIMETAEQFRYVVGFEALTSFALSVNQDLQTGDEIKIGPFDGSDGYFMRLNSTLGPTKAELAIVRDGTEKANKEIDIKDIRDFTLFRQQWNWYNVGNFSTTQSFTVVGGRQENNYKGAIGIDGDRGPRQANLPLRFEVTAGSGTSNLQLKAGSVSWQTLGQVSAINREKAAHISTTGTTIDSTGTWIPFAAIRKKPDLDLVNVQISNLNVAEYSSSNDVRVLGIAASTENTDASGFSTPPEQNPRNSAIEQTQNVTTFPDNSGSAVSSATNPGGYQAAYDALYTTGGFFSSEQKTTSVSIRRTLYRNDVIVLLANATGTGDIKLDYVSRQDW